MKTTKSPARAETWTSDFRESKIKEESQKAKDKEAWAGHGPVSWTGRANAESLPPTGPDFKVYQNRGVFLAKWKKRG